MVVVVVGWSPAAAGRPEVADGGWGRCWQGGGFMSPKTHVNARIKRKNKKRKKEKKKERIKIKRK